VVEGDGSLGVIMTIHLHLLIPSPLLPKVNPAGQVGGRVSGRVQLSVGWLITCGTIIIDSATIRRGRDFTTGSGLDLNLHLLRRLSHHGRRGVEAALVGTEERRGRVRIGVKEVRI